MMIPGDRNVFLAKYDSTGNQLWARHIESVADEWSDGIAVDGFGSAYITGISGSRLLVSKYDLDGNHVWTDTSSIGWGRGIDVDVLGNAYVTGQTGFEGSDVFVTKFDENGSVLWTQEFGSESIDHGIAISLDGLGNVYVTGETFGNMAAPNAGDFDVFVARLSPVPEPTTIVLFAVGLVGVAISCRPARDQRAWDAYCRSAIGLSGD
jgi:hypothetical protein